MQSYWFSKQSRINIIYNISVITITITMSIILANFGKYAISDCPFILLFVYYCIMMVCVVYCVAKWQGWGQFSSGIGIAALFQFQFRNWNWNWNWWNWKWNWNWKLWNWSWKSELNFLQMLPQHLPVNQQFPNFSINRGHNLPCDWLLMQQGSFKFLEHCPPVHPR